MATPRNPSRDWRGEGFITQREMADIVGVSPRMIGDLELGGMPVYRDRGRGNRKWYRFEECEAWVRSGPTLPTSWPPFEPYRDWAPLERDYASVLQADPCSYCGAPMENVDHIVPVARGGEHAWSNFTAACRACNCSKLARPLLTFLMARTVA